MLDLEPIVLDRSRVGNQPIYKSNSAPTISSRFVATIGVQIKPLTIVRFEEAFCLCNGSFHISLSARLLKNSFVRYIVTYRCIAKCHKALQNARVKQRTPASVKIFLNKQTHFFTGNFYVSYLPSEMTFLLFFFDKKRETYCKQFWVENSE